MTAFLIWDDAERIVAKAVPCPLCKVPAGTECVNSVDGSGPRDQPHHSRPVRARIVTNAITYNLTHPDATP